MFNTIKQRRNEARKNGDKVTNNILTVLTGELENIAKRDGGEVSNELVQATCKKFVKSNNEVLSHSVDEETKTRLNAENAVLSDYLPTYLTEQQIKDIITKENLTSMPDVMKHMSQNYAGQFDGKAVKLIAVSLFK